MRNDVYQASAKLLTFFCKIQWIKDSLNSHNNLIELQDFIKNISVSLIIIRHVMNTMRPICMNAGK